MKIDESSHYYSFYVPGREEGIVCLLVAPKVIKPPALTGCRYHLAMNGSIGILRVF